MADFGEIENALLTALADSPELTDLLSDFTWSDGENHPAIFVGLAPLETEDAYLVIHRIAIVPDDTNSTRGEKLIFQINAHGLTFNICRNIMSAVDAVLHRENLITMLDYILVETKRISGPNHLPQDGEDRLIGETADYQITVQEYVS